MTRGRERTARALRLARSRSSRYAAEKLTPEQERFYRASQWQIMWWKFRRHRIAVIAGAILLAFYASILVSEFLAPYNLHTRDTRHIYAPPQALHLFHEGSFVGPFVYGYSMRARTCRPCSASYTRRPGQGAAAALLLPRRRVRVLGPGRRQLPPRLPAPRAARSSCSAPTASGAIVLSRIIYGTRISLTVGPARHRGELPHRHRRSAAFPGYYGGWIDNVIQRFIEMVRSLPELPLWMALSAALPVNWSPILVYFGITIILGLLDWPGLARAVRSKLLALREEDFATAAVLMGASPARVIAQPPAARASPAT